MLEHRKDVGTINSVSQLIVIKFGYTHHPGVVLDSNPVGKKTRLIKQRIILFFLVKGRFYATFDLFQPFVGSRNTTNFFSVDTKVHKG
ncbi:hypothetical protein Hanom_Chr02g00138931 [Helianthus anomalus]